MPSSRPLRGATSPKVKAPVTAEIIDGAVPRDSGHCMLAKAIEVARPDAKFIAVDLQTIRFSENGRRYIYLTPRTAQRALIDFDHGVRPEPFVLNLRNAQVMIAGSRGKKREPVELVINPAGGGTIPIVKGGQAPPTGLLSNQGTNRGNRTGKRREFGLRAALR